MHRALALLALVLSGCLALVQHDGRWACTNDGDCNGGDVCRQIAGSSTCAAADYCEVASDCNPGGFGSQSMECIANRCAVPPCTSNADCTPYTCESGGSCGSSCANDAQCVPGYRCTGSRCVAPPCSDDSQCGGFRCASNGTCATSCAVNTDCAPSSICTGLQTCEPRSCSGAAAGQCGGFVCGSGGLCETSCAESKYCDPGLVCMPGGSCACATGSCGGLRCVNGACLTACQSDSDCDAGLLCSPQGKCVACTGTPTPCANVPNCTAVSGCSAGTPTCTGASFDCSLYNGDAVSCSNNYTCVWYSSSGTCSGTTSCSSVPVGTCGTIFGCTLATTPCSGTPKACSSLPYSQCAGTPGCSLK